MNHKHLEILIKTLTERIERLEEDLKYKDYALESLQKKLKIYEERQGE